MANTTNTGLSLSSTGANLTQLSHGQKILVAAAMEAFEPAAPDPDLISSQRIPAGHKQWDIQTVARMADAAALTEGVDLAQTQQLFVNTVQITPTEHGIIATVSKELIRRQGNMSVMPVVGSLIGNSLRRRMAKDVIALYSGFSKDGGGGAGAALDITHVRGSTAYLLTDNDSEYGPAQLPLHGALHIEQISDIILDITDTAPRGTTTGISGDMLQRWWRGTDRLYGAQFFHSGNIARDSGDDAIGFYGNPAAAAIVMANEAEATEETDNSLRAIELGMFQSWGESEVVDWWAVNITSDAAATT